MTQVYVGHRDISVSEQTTMPTDLDSMPLDRPQGIGRTRMDKACGCVVCRCDDCMEWWPLTRLNWRTQPERNGKTYPRRVCRACEVERRMAS